MEFSSKTRTEVIKKLASEQLDLLIIGGGITGAGLALQAGAKEMNAGLIEMQDFAAGTSSRSTKLVHGGLRYLKQFEVELVAEIVKERKVISNNAPHIVQPEKMLLPVYEEAGASFTAFSADIALDLYDRLAESYLLSLIPLALVAFAFLFLFLISLLILEYNASMSAFNLLSEPCALTAFLVLFLLLAINNFLMNII